MRSFRDAKLMARVLRAELALSGVDLSHGRALEIVAAQFGLPNWNVLAAMIGAAAMPTGTTPVFQGAIPILRIFDLALARRFYADFLGMTEDWEHRFGPDFPAYLQVSRSGLTLHLSEHHGDASPGGTAFVWMRALDEFHTELIARNAVHAKPGIETWDMGVDDVLGTRIGMRVMEIVDPFGNRLRFAERLPTDRPAEMKRTRSSPPAEATDPPGGGAVSFARDKLEVFSDAVSSALADSPEGISFAELTERVASRLPAGMVSANHRWWVALAREDLETRGAVERVPRGRTHLVRRTRLGLSDDAR